MQNFRFYRRRLGRMTITALYDGYIDVPLEVLNGIDLASAEQLYDGQSPHRPTRISMTTFAISEGENIILVDAGGTRELDPDLGLRNSNMLAADIDPLKVSAVLLTHLHTDHYGSLVQSDGSATFPNAELIVPTDEIPFRLEPSDASKLSEEEAVSFARARRAVLPYRDRMRTVREGSVLSGISAVPLPGHTPGHTGWQIESDSEVLLIAGDLVHFPSIQFEFPRVGLAYDTGPRQAIDTRLRIFAEAAREGYLIAGMHLNFPCFGHIDSDGDKYVWKPDVKLKAN